MAQIERQFSFSREVGALVISLFVSGYCIGPLVFGPLSEAIGRKSVFVFTFIFYTGFQVGSALAQNTAQVLVFRFLGGTFASAPLANSGFVPFLNLVLQRPLFLSDKYLEVRPNQDSSLSRIPVK